MEAVYNKDRALKRTMGDQELLAELLDFTLKDLNKQLQQLEASVEEPRLLKDAAHRLKGTAGAVGADRLYQSCFQLEQMAQNEEKAHFNSQIELIKEDARQWREHPDVLKAIDRA